MSKDKSRVRVPFTYSIGSIGAALSVVISWERSHSILWAALHGFTGWLYVIWFSIWGR